MIQYHDRDAVSWYGHDKYHHCANWNRLHHEYDTWIQFAYTRDICSWSKYVHNVWKTYWVHCKLPSLHSYWCCNMNTACICTTLSSLFHTDKHDVKDDDIHMDTNHDTCKLPSLHYFFSSFFSSFTSSFFSSSSSCSGRHVRICLAIDAVLSSTVPLWP